jgi:hypothetical protein
MFSLGYRGCLKFKAVFKKRPTLSWYSVAYMKPTNGSMNDANYGIRQGQRFYFPENNTFSTALFNRKQPPSSGPFRPSNISGIVPGCITVNVAERETEDFTPPSSPNSLRAFNRACSGLLQVFQIIFRK